MKSIPSNIVREKMLLISSLEPAYMDPSEMSYDFDTDSFRVN